MKLKRNANAMQWSGSPSEGWAPVGATIPTLDPGIYNIHVNMFGVFIQPTTPKHDAIVSTGLAAEISAEITKFLDSRAIYQKLKFLHKRGILLIGYPGTGKSMTAMLLAQHVVTKGGIALIGTTEPNHTAKAISNVRAVQPDTPILVLFEEIEEAYEENSHMMLQMLDGEVQFDNIIWVGTTNNPQQLDSRFLNRPGRFDTVRWVGPPPTEVRFTYLRSILPADLVSDDTCREMATKSEGLLISHLRDLVCRVFIIGTTIDDAITDMRAVAQASDENDERRKALEAIQQKMPADLRKQLKDVVEAVKGTAAA